MSKKNILFINGVADKPEIHVKTIDSNGVHSFQYHGNTNVYKYLPNTHFNKTVLNLDARQDQEIRLPDIDAIFNQILNADTHKVTLSKVESLYHNLTKEIPLFNAPSNVRKTTRDNIYNLLQGIDKLHIPKTVRIQPKSPSDIYDAIKKENFEFPVIIRQTNDQDDINSLLIEDTSEKFHTFALDGRDYYLIEFINYHLNGFYRKESLVVVDGEVFISDVQFGENWSINQKNQLSNADTDIMKKSIAKRFQNEIKPAIQPIITEIYNKLGLDYFGIDCHIDQDKNISIFKIKSNMDIFDVKKENIFADDIIMIHSKVIKMIHEKVDD